MRWSEPLDAAKPRVNSYPLSVNRENTRSLQRSLSLFSLGPDEVAPVAYRMKVVRESSLEEYARQFWQRQSRKHTPDDVPALENIGSGGDPINWLVDLYPYKLPKPCNAVVQIVMIETSPEAEKLLLHDYMMKDDWTVERCLVPCPKTRRLGKMVTTALERDYFETDRPDTQIRIYKEWSDKTTTDGLILEDALPLIEMTWSDEFEIVDGWGRLHALLALVRKGLSFEPFKCFAASRVRI